MFILFTCAVQTTEGLKNMPVKEGVTTCEVVKILNDIFDSMNGRREDLKRDKNALRKKVTADTSHMTYWKEASSILANNIHFVDVTTTKCAFVEEFRNDVDWISTPMAGFTKIKIYKLFTADN